MKRKPYPSSDLSDAQWALVRPLVPAAKSGRHGGCPRKTDMREVVCACLYFVRNGCAWRALPHDFPPEGTVKNYYYSWAKDGTWERIHDALRDKVRDAAGKNVQPTTGIMDSQSVKTTEKGGLAVTMPARR